jgi:DNA modification methylase
VKRAGVFIQYPYPGTIIPNIMTEYILIFKKPGDPIFRAVGASIRKAQGTKWEPFHQRDRQQRLAHSPVPPRTIDHPCPFPEEIPYRLVQLYTYPGDTVLDPFLGSGQTTKVAFALGRNAVGYDVVDRYVEYSWQRLREPLGRKAIPARSRVQAYTAGCSTGIRQGGLQREDPARLRTGDAVQTWGSNAAARCDPKTVPALSSLGRAPRRVV